MIFNRVWAMPNADTFSVQPINEFVKRYLRVSRMSVDMFARNKDWADHTNDLNPSTSAQYHMDAKDFCVMLAGQNVKADLILFDPPYSPRQITEVYASIGRKATMQDTQTASLYKNVRDVILPICGPEAVVLSFGWNSVGMGVTNNFELIEILLVCHGGAHNDTICIAEKRLPDNQIKLL